MKGILRKTPLFASLTEKEMQALALRTISERWNWRPRLSDRHESSEAQFFSGPLFRVKPVVESPTPGVRRT